jgi:adenosylcobinamide-phosphate synthase
VDAAAEKLGAEGLESRTHRIMKNVFDFGVNITPHTGTLDLVLIAAVSLDWCLGDPSWIPHPIIYFGKAISWFERRFNNNNNNGSSSNALRIFKGAITSMLLVSLTYILFRGLLQTCHRVHPYLGMTVEAVFTFLGLAGTTLIREGRNVFQAVDESLEKGRKRVAWIVSRDTSNLNEHQIRIATMECLSENLSDGVIGPLLSYGVGGMPGIMAYKMINTLDSMIGYKNDRYYYYGKFAARLDDVANLIPARWTAFCMCVVATLFLPSTEHKSRTRPWQFVYKYRNAHSSPNAAYPEAALAGILNVQFGGPNKYFGGTVVDKPFIGVNARSITNNDLQTTILINRLTELLTILVILYLKSR